MVEFRKRFPPEAIAAILEANIPKKTDDSHDDHSEPGDGSGNKEEETKAETDETESKGETADAGTATNQGSLIMDATCYPADIVFPQDFQLLNHARELLEEIVRKTCKENGCKVPRMYPKLARKSYLNLSRSKKRSAKSIRKCVKQQLQFIHRDIGYIANMIRDKGIYLEQPIYDLLNTLTTLYEQQLYMFEHRIHSIPDRIVSISQPWVRPIVRGKAHDNTEFGAKLHISMVNGYARIEQLSFDAFNEASDFFRAVESYRKRNGFYPKRVLIDKIYRNRETIAWCKERNIQPAGPALGRPPKGQNLAKAAKQQEYQDICDRNIVEGEFGTGKRAYGLNRIMAHLPEASFCVIGVALLCMNLTKRLRSLCFDLFFILIKSTRFCCIESQV